MDDEARGGCEASLVVMVVDWRRRVWLDCCG